MPWIYDLSLIKQPLLLLICSLSLVACSSHVPKEIRQASPDQVPLSTVHSNIEQHIGKRVRWGGVILHIENQNTSTWLTIMAKPLWASGRPNDSDTSYGRFIAIIPGFLEPEVYANQREITITGRVTGTQARKVGDFEYNYPLIEVDQQYLWHKPVTTEHQHPHWYHDPWYDPFYPYHSYHPHPHLH